MNSCYDRSERVNVKFTGANGGSVGDLAAGGRGVIITVGTILFKGDTLYAVVAQKVPRTLIASLIGMYN